MSRWPPELRRKAKNKYGYGCRTGKRRYTSHSAAYNDMLAINARGGPVLRPIRNVYRCQQCGGFHLTSQEPGTHAERKQGTGSKGAGGR